MRQINEIIIHCSATRPNWLYGKGIAAKIDEIRRWHKARRFNDIGYHYLVDRPGDVGKGRDVSKSGAHCKGHNANSIGICLIGGLWPDGTDSKPTDNFSDHFTPQQDKAIRALIEKLKDEYPSISKISGHNEYAAKGCPGFTVAEWLNKHQPATEVPAQGILASIVAFILGLFGGKK